MSLEDAGQQAGGQVAQLPAATSQAGTLLVTVVGAPAVEQAGGQVAQLVEHTTENRGVGSSILPLATRQYRSDDGDGRP